MSWIDDPKKRVCAWQVRIPYSQDGQRRVWRKLVSLAAYGGTKESLRTVARLLRDEVMEKLGVHDPGLGIYHRQRSPRNASGVTGVRCGRYLVRGRPYEFWEARWKTREGKVGRKAFAVARYGARRAKELAIAARQEALRREAEKAVGIAATPR